MLDMQIYHACVYIMHMLLSIHIDAMLPKRLKRLTLVVERINILNLHSD